MCSSSGNHDAQNYKYTPSDGNDMSWVSQQIWHIIIQTAQQSAGKCKVGILCCGEDHAMFDNRPQQRIPVPILSHQSRVCNIVLAANISFVVNNALVPRCISVNSSTCAGHFVKAVGYQPALSVYDAEICEEIVRQFVLIQHNAIFSPTYCRMRKHSPPQPRRPVFAMCVERYFVDHVLSVPHVLPQVRRSIRAQRASSPASFHKTPGLCILLRTREAE
mmetsp:Transcript_52328/g.98175  ORF Transcript_52328/g.98175 Transcript_52328/m.98175 type:complete len:219 (-) Transcript_52328:30-686(-)